MLPATTISTRKPWPCMRKHLWSAGTRGRRCAASNVNSFVNSTRMDSIGLGGEGAARYSGVARGIRDARLAEAARAQAAGVAAAACAAIGGRIVAGMRERVIHAQRSAERDDAGLVETHQRRVHGEARAL